MFSHAYCEDYFWQARRKEPTPQDASPLLERSKEDGEDFDSNTTDELFGHLFQRVLSNMLIIFTE